METKNIYQRMSAITDEINRVAKNLTVGEGKSAYKAAGEADILTAVKPAESKHGIYSYPLEREIIETNVLTNISTDYKGNSVEKNNYSCVYALCIALSTSITLISILIL